MTRPIHYTRAELEAGLRAAGLTAGDTVFVHASLGRLGYPDRGPTVDAACAVAHEALSAVIGEQGTLVVPTYTYSIGGGEVFDVDATPSTVGAFTEHVRRLPGAIRSAEPMLSVAAVGPRAAALTADLPLTSYGAGSIYERLCEVDAKLCLLGLDLHWATFRHFIEERARVPFRFLKTFTGTVRQNGSERREQWLYFAAPRQPECGPDGVRLARLARDTGLGRAAPVGRGEVSVIGCRQYLALGLEALAADPWLTARGPSLTLAALCAREDERVEAWPPAVEMLPDATAPEILAALSPLRRDVVSSGSEALLAAIGRVIPLEVARIASGQPCGRGVVPEKWTLHEARLETVDGRLVFSDEDTPARVPAYARSFEGVVSRETLLAHLHVEESSPDAIPFVSRRAAPDWGFCCSKRERESLTAETYRVVLRADVSFGALCVGHATWPGETDTTLLLAAHLGPSGAPDEGLSGVAVLVEVFRRLIAVGPRRTTVRLVIAPAEVGFSAWLRARPDALRHVVACLAVDRVAGPGPLVGKWLGGDPNFMHLTTAGPPFYLVTRRRTTARAGTRAAAESNSPSTTGGARSRGGAESLALTSAVAAALDILAQWDSFAPEIVGVVEGRAS